MYITKQENSKQWKELCAYIRKNVLKYDNNRIFPQVLAIRLRGLACGVNYKKKNDPQLYTYDFILKVFKYLDNIIQETIERTEIQDEKHLCNLIMKIVRENFNDVAIRYNKMLKMKRQLEESTEDDILVETKSEYKKRTKKAKQDW